MLGLSLAAQNPSAGVPSGVDGLLAQWRGGTLTDADLARELTTLGGQAAPYLCELLDESAGQVPVVPIVDALVHTGGAAAVAAFGRLLQSVVVAHRLAAVGALGSLRCPEAYPYLVGALDDDDGKVVASAEALLLAPEHAAAAVVAALGARVPQARDKTRLARVLADKGGAEAHALLLALAAAPDADSQMAGLSGLARSARLGDGERVLEILGQAKVKEVKVQACLALGSLRFRGAVRGLIDLMREADDPGVVAAAHAALGQITGWQVGADSARWEQWWEGVGRLEATARGEVDQKIAAHRRGELSAAEFVEALVALGVHAVPYLSDLLDVHRAEVPARSIAEALGRMGTPEAVPALGRLLDSEQEADRMTAAAALASLRHADACAPLVRALDDDNAGVVEQAETGLLANEHSTASIVVAVRERMAKATHKSRLARLLARRGGDAAHDELVAMTSAYDPKQQVAGLQGLRLAGRAEDGALVTRMLAATSSPTVRKEACLVVGRLRHWGAVRSLIDLLDDDAVPGLRANAHWGLKQISGLQLGPDRKRWELWWQLTGSQRAQQEGG